MPHSLSDHWRRPSTRPLILGHRGSSLAAPENTLAAFELAMKEGADGIELDVRLNANGQVIVTHDDSLQRVTHGVDTRLISELSTSQCARVQLADNQPLASLQEVLEWSAPHQACINIELKMDGPKAHQLARAVGSMLLGHQHAWPRLLVSSFSMTMVWAHRRQLPQIPCAWLTSSPTMCALPWLPRAAAIHPIHTELTAQRTARWQRRGFRVHAWTVDNPTEAKRLSSWGVDALITNQPGKLREALAT